MKSPTLDAGAAISLNPPASPDLTTGLVGHWKFDDGVGSRTVADASGNGNQGTIADLDLTAAWTTGKVSGALEIPYGDTATTRGVRVPASASIDAILHFTIAAWVYRTRDVPLHTCVLSRQLGTTTNELYNLTFDKGELVLYVPPNSAAGMTAHVLTSGRSTRLADWMHVAATYDGAELRLYLDGVMVASKPYSARLPRSTNPVFIGNNVNTGVNADPLGGRVDEVLLYSRALPANAIAALHERPSAP
jgi:hypothetical protein